MPRDTHLFQLVAAAIGQPAAEWVFAHVHIPEELSQFTNSEAQLHRAWLAEALNLSLLHKLVDAVPNGRLYVEEQLQDGRQVVFDHGAIRTVDWPENGALPRGRHAFTRLLEPLGFTDVRTYPLTKLKMTGYAYRHVDLPADIAQFFVSELHPGRFSEAFQQSVTRLCETSRDPLGAADLATLRTLRQTRHCTFAAALDLMPALYRAFDCQHATVQESDYQTLLAESAEMAWISTEGNRFNHLTDRVIDLQAVVDHQRTIGRPMKDSIEVSSSRRVMQTAYKAVQVQRELIDAHGQTVQRTVPGSFVEFIQREVEEETGLLDLHFDSSNAQGIFKMTDSR